MRNRITCSAQKLSQLEPNMVQSVVGGHVFKLGKQYLSESRVRIIDSNESQITSEVAGTYGVYSQNIRLKGGTLTTKCSCPASEQPFCRHCVAVLLEFYQSFVSVPPSEPETPQEITTYESTVESVSTNPPVTSASPVDLKFHEVSMFIEWVQATVSALKNGSSMPRLPDSGAGQVRTWAEAIKDLWDRYQWSDETRCRVESELQDCQRRIVSLTQELEGVTQEAKESKVACASLRRELEESQDMLEKYSEIAKERDRYVDQLNSMRGELLRKGAELDSLAASLKQVAAALQAVTPPPR